MEQTLEHTKEYCLRNIAPAMGSMLVFVLSAFLVYKGFYAGPTSAASFASMEPAAGMELIHENGITYIPVDITNIPVVGSVQTQEH